MKLVVADTSPINYLVLIGHIEILPRLFERVIVPSAVHRELSQVGAPVELRDWLRTIPAWLEVMHPPTAAPLAPLSLDEGESEAISLASHLSVDLLLMDERAGTRVAQALGLQVTGTIGILDLAAELDLLNFAESIHALKKTNFRLPSRILAELEAKHAASSAPDTPPTYPASTPPDPA